MSLDSGIDYCEPVTICAEKTITQMCLPDGTATYTYGTAFSHDLAIENAQGGFGFDGFFRWDLFANSANFGLYYMFTAESSDLRDVISGFQMLQDVNVGLQDTDSFETSVFSGMSALFNLSGGLGDDFLAGAMNADKLDGGEGFDALFGAGGDDSIIGGAGDDYIEADGMDWVSVDTGQHPGGAYAYTPGDVYDISIGNDIVDAGAGDDVAYGGQGDDDLTMGEGNDYGYGDAGNDNLRGNMGEDELHGGAGDDWVAGGKDGDVLFGDGLTWAYDEDTDGDGEDEEEGSYLEYVADEDLGDDCMAGGDGDDWMFGDNGYGKRSPVALSNDDDWEDEEDAGGDDRMLGGNGDDLMFGQGGDDAVGGEAGDDYVNGGDGDDLVDGGDGDDVVIAGNGDDIVRGGFGEDTMYGGEGCDKFVFCDTDFLCDADWIKDFSTLDGDQIDLSHVLGLTEIRIESSGIHGIAKIDLFAGDKNIQQIIVQADSFFVDLASVFRDDSTYGIDEGAMVKVASGVLVDLPSVSVISVESFIFG